MNQMMKAKQKRGNRALALVIALIMVLTGAFSTPIAKAASGTFNISSTNAGYSSYSPFLNGVYNSNKSAMDGAAEWKFTQPNSSAPMVIGKSYSASYDADLTLPTSLEKMTGYGTTTQGTELADSGNLWVSYTGGKVIFPAGINITVYNIWFSCDVDIESGAIVTFEECGFDTEPSIANGQVQPGAGKVMIDNKVVRDGVQTYSVTYKDGVGGTAFPDQVTGDLKENDATPTFSGTPTREGYDFIGWEPEVSEKVTKDSIYTAVWEEKAPEHVKSISVDAKDSSKGTLTLNVTGKEEKGTSESSASDETKVDVVFVVDASGSMSLEYDAQATDYYGNRYTKAEAAIRALISKPSYSYEGMLPDLINDVNVDARAAIVSFSDSGKIEGGLVNSLSDLYSAAWKCKGYGETNIEDGLVKAEQALASARTDAKKVVILLTDGEPNRYNGGGSGTGNYVQEAGDAAIAQAKKMKTGVDEFYAIGYGSGYNSNGSGFLQSLANEFGGSMLPSAGGTALKTVLSNIKTQAVKPIVKEDKTLRGITIQDELSDDVELDGTFTPIVKLDNETVDKNKYVASESNGTITVKFKDDFVVPKDNILSVSFDVKIKDSKDAGTYKTNKKAELTYVFGDSTADAKTVEYIEEPELTKEAEYIYTLKHDVNGGTGTIADVTKTSKNDSEKLAVSSDEPVRDGYTFKGWADSASAATADYQAGDEIQLTSDAPAKTIYAVWKKNETKPETKPDTKPTEPEKKIADIPEGSDKTYNGKEQTGVTAGAGYTVKNGSGTDAGSYKATATLKDGYVWSDGSTESKEIIYRIKPAVLTATYVSEAIEWYGTPKNAVKVTGFVGGETAKTVAGYKTPTVKKVKTQPHKKYKRTPSGGTAKNYTFRYVKGTLTVQCKDVLVLTTTDGKSKAKLKWTRVRGADGYKIYGNLCNENGHKYKPKYKKTIKGNKNRKTTIKTKRNEYKYYVVAYKVVNGKKITLARSNITHTMIGNSKPYLVNANKVTVNKKALTLKKGKTVKIRGKVKKKGKKELLWKTHCAKITYLSSDKHIATVNKKGKVKAVGKGKCRIYAIAPNGIWKAVTVTVK